MSGTSLLRLLLSLLCWLRAQCIKFGLCLCVLVGGTKVLTQRSDIFFIFRNKLVHKAAKVRRVTTVSLSSSLISRSTECKNTSPTTSVTFHINCEIPWNVMPHLSIISPLNSLWWKSNYRITMAQQGVTSPSRQRELASNDRNSTKHGKTFQISPIPNNSTFLQNLFTIWFQMVYCWKNTKCYRSLGSIQHTLHDLTNHIANTYIRV